MMDEGHWDPWSDFKQDADLLPIVEPPCRNCLLFRPVRKFDSHGKFDGVRVCHADEMESDYSCFKKRAKSEG